MNEAIQLIQATTGVGHGTMDFTVRDMATPQVRAWIEAELAVRFSIYLGTQGIETGAEFEGAY